MITSAVNRAVWAAIVILSAVIAAATWLGMTPFTWLEVFAFISGLACVWLTVVASHWNWPVGNINAASFLVLFVISRLFANAFLQVVFIVLGFWGWYMWLRKMDNDNVRPIGYADTRTMAILAIAVLLLTYPVRQFLIAVDGAAPFWDTLTTMISLAATYLQAKKLVQSWHLWISVDVIYIALFYSRELYLTSFLYVIFLTMAISGLFGWRSVVAHLTSERRKKQCQLTES